MKQRLVNLLKEDPSIKKLVLWMLQPKNQARPRWWVRVILNPFLHQRGRGSLICSATRMDIFPFNEFQLGDYSTIEDFATINNGVGSVIIGRKSRIGIGNTIIGPVEIGDNVILAQNIVISGLNHGYEDIHTPPNEQPVSKSLVSVGDNCWIGANAVITAGVNIGKHVVVGAGSVVTKNVPAYSLVAGNPAKLLKRYSEEAGCWIKV